MANSMTDDVTGAYTGGIPLNVTLHAWPVPKIEEKLKPFNDTGSGTVRISESAKNYTNSLHNLNATGYVAIDDDLTDTGFTDVQTFILAGIATLIPLLVAVATVLGIRFAWKRYRLRKEDGYEGVLQKEESSEPLGKLQGYSLPQELKTSESQFTVTPGEEPTTTSSPQLATPKSNGSIITMTLKNNHLIVETEENINTAMTLKIESKGTTTKFVTPAGTDFKIVTIAETGNDFEEKCENTCKSVHSTSDHGALVHSPPEETEDELDKGSCNTGLSQSDLSISSMESQNPSYRYGNQMGYDSGGYGYAEYSGYALNAQKQCRPSLMEVKDHKNYFRSSSMIENTDPVTGKQVEAPFKNVLMSDIQAHEKKVQEDKEKRYQEEQRILGNGNTSSKNEAAEEASNGPNFKSEKINYLSDNNTDVNTSFTNES